MVVNGVAVEAAATTHAAVGSTATEFRVNLAGGYVSLVRFKWLLLLLLLLWLLSFGVDGLDMVDPIGCDNVTC